MRLRLRYFPFLTRESRVTYSRSEIKHKADALDSQLRLIMHGIPIELVEHATANQLAVMEEIVNRDIETELKIKTVATSNGIATAFGGKK